MKSKGLGDTIEKITKATGIHKATQLIEKVTKKPCGCGKRKEALNKAVPYNKQSPVQDNIYQRNINK